MPEQDRLCWYINRMGDGHEKQFELCVQAYNGDTRTIHEDIPATAEELRSLVQQINKEISCD